MNTLEYALSILMLGAIFCAARPAAGQTPPDRMPRVGAAAGSRWFEQSGHPYRAKPVSPVSFDNSSRIDSLLRAGNLYLSLEDAIALVLENNLDIELQRFGPAIAASDVLRAKGGGASRGVSLTVAQPPAGLGGPISPLLTAATPTTVPTSGSVPISVTDVAVIAQAQTNLSITSQIPSSAGPQVPAFDPSLAGQLGISHQSTPQASSFVTGTNTLIARNLTDSVGLIQGFSPGTQVSLSFNGVSQNTNSIRSTFNPFTSTSLGLTITQPLLRGFGAAVNRRFIRIANNNEKMADLVFRQQVTDMVSGVIRLYYDFVSLIEDVKVKQQTLALAQSLYQDNQAQVRQGVMAAIDLVRAQALIAAAQQDLANAQGFAREQEFILKTVLTRRGTADAAIRAASIVATTPIPEGGEPVQPIQDLIALAFKNRPELALADLQLTNSKISLEGARNELLPDLSLFSTFQNSGLAGDVNELLPPQQPGSPFSSTVSPAFIGGFGTTLSQVFRRHFPTYGVGIQLNLPLRNRVAQADYVRDELQHRQALVRRQQLENTIRLEVENAVIAVERTRAAYEAAAQARIFQEQSLAAEQKKYGVGASTTFLIGQYQAFLAQARSTEVAARVAHAKTRAVLQRAIGMTLANHGVSIDEAYRGRVAKPPSEIH